ncbi:MAG: hypothetical protein ACP5PA_05715 [Elusimicrobiales bacterium]
MVGEDEIKTDLYSIKNLKNGIQEKKNLNQIIKLLKNNGG